ncbi:MAG: EAL domain-containing protein [Eubacterium sp.]|nr:EAL domain-containing protein [Eubacterium sp.]
MFTNKLNQLYKPRRYLYYVAADDAMIGEFYKGNIPGQIADCSGAFGTYDYPGIFYINSTDSALIGIEYRMDDDRINYPQGLDCMEMDECFFYSVEIDEEAVPGRDSICDMFKRIAADDDAHRLYSDLSINDEPGVIGVFAVSRKIRILYECTPDEDRAQYIINDDMDSIDKKVLFKSAFFDPITDHYNWNHLEAFLEMPMDMGISDYAFVHFDVKEFRIINEVYGHIAANRVLRNVVQTMKTSDFVYTSARCHNDNFAMMIRDMPTDEMIDRLEAFFAGLSCLEEDPDYHIYYRCGVVPMQRAMHLGNRVADAGKMAQALGTKHNKTEIIIYSDQMHDDISWGNYIKAYVETAIRMDEFVVYLQPKYDIRTETLHGAEALIRWNYKNREFLSPARFIPFFEKDGSIGKIDDIVLEKVCAAMKKWESEGKTLLPVSVNLSRNRLYDAHLIDHLTEIVDSYGVRHELIDFELTESATYDNKEHMLSVLNELKERGFRISMDDFGTGYSSLSLLTEMPFDTLKIDKSFVDKVASDNEKEEDIIVIRHIISLAGELGFECLAEGAETVEQVDRLRELGCDIVQGYYYSKPIPMDQYENKIS